MSMIYILKMLRGKNIGKVLMYIGIVFMPLGGKNNASSSPDWSESSEVKMRKQPAPHRMGISMGGNIMAEMKARQEKIASRQVCAKLNFPSFSWPENEMLI